MSIFADCNPDLIITDIIMPFKSGVDLLRDVKSMNNTPVVMLTAVEKEGIKEMAMGYGALAYLHKPLKKKDIQSILKELSN